METPIYSFLEQYAAEAPLRLHMPGHKGIAPVDKLSAMYALDLTEISGADELFDAEGIIAASEKKAARLYHTAATAYSCGGSTLCIQAMLYLMQQEGRQLVAARTVHRAFLNACVLLRLPVTWVYPDTGHGILSGDYSPSAFAKALDALPDKGKHAAVYITSPDYLGHMADISGIAVVCHERGARLLVDNAHGSHLAFLPQQLHPMALGADLCCDSAHKMLPALTGCAYLHTAVPSYAHRLKSAMALFASTSPSYLMLASLDLCNVFLAEQAKIAAERLIPELMKLRHQLAEKFCLAAPKGDAFHLSIDTAAMGIDGRKLGAWLEGHHCYPEYIGREALVLLFSLSDSVETVRQVGELLCQMPLPEKNAPPTIPPTFPKPKRVCDIATAALAPCETIPVTQALGRICGMVDVPCPPAIPLVLSGECIDEAVCQTLTYYGIHRVRVVSENASIFA